MWEWFNGKKTVIGAVLLFTATVIDQVIVGIYADEYKLILTPAWLLATKDSIQWLGLAVTGGGVLHKIAKDAGRKNGKPPAGE